jgi:DNA topoisomerase-1
VQSVALRLVCEREEAIAKFVPQEYWTLDAEFRSPRGDLVRATLEKIGKAKPVLDTGDKAYAARDDIKSQTFSVRNIERKEKRRNPRAPYITSTLQQDGARRLGFSARKTMTVAQALYEGIDLGEEGAVGLITYMRTDSVRVAPEACDGARDFIISSYGDKYVPGKATKFRKPKSSQDAHEAIRPTDAGRTPESVAQFLTKDQARLYRLIWERFLASQMSQAVYDVTTARIEGGPYLFRASGSVMRFDGFLKVYGERLEEEEEQGIPPLEIGDPLALEKIDANRHETEPPPRFTESSLIKELEDKGIGRPSTYATIVTTILDRDYVEKAKGALAPTELGTTVLKVLLRMFPDIFEVDFTARMESELDRIESGQDQWVKVISDFYEPFSKNLESADKMRKELKVAVEEEVEQKCEVCGRPMVKKWGRHGRFLACSGFPECKTTKPLEEQVSVDTRCPECGGEMIVRTGRYGRFLACKSYPACKGTQRFTLGIKCPECGGQMVEKKTKRGRIFYGCQEYPKCKFATWDKPVTEQCPHCQFPIMVSKSSGEKGSRLECPKCKGGAESRQ